MNRKHFLLRIGCVFALLGIMCAYFFYLLYDATVLNPITDTTSVDLNLTTTTETEEAARGMILDRNGTVLVGNKTLYRVELDADLMGDAPEQAEVVSRLIAICKEQGLTWTDEEFPVEYNAESGSFYYTTDTPYLVVSDGVYTATRLSKLCQQMEWGVGGSFTGTSADTLVRQMCETFNLSDELTPQERLEILGVLYSALLRSGTDQLIWTDYYFLEDVDFSFISVVKEEGLAGVNIVSTTERAYYTDYAGVLLGQIGAISAESWESNKESYLADGYAMDSIIGLSGVESAFESDLRGTDGVKEVTRDLDGNVVSETYTTEPVAGNNVYLTLDIGLQQAVEEALEAHTFDLNDGAGGSAAVVIDVDSGEVLACGTYPTFSAADYAEDYAELAADELLPLYNRALVGTYAPGSTYKICSATAALSSGAITTATTFNCTGSFQYYDTVQHCANRSGHGLENTEYAIRDSCNVYFYNIAAIIGIDTLTEYAQAYGLGVSSGIELAESLGVNAGPAYSEQMGVTWYEGNALSAAIGQSDNQFTVLQIANYIATFINGGDRYAAHLKKSVTTYDNSTVVETVEPTILNHVELSSDGYYAIKKGMGEVADSTNITVFDTLRANGIEVGCKTGTAELGKTGLNNGLFVVFAPYDDPEIAICTVVEKGKTGSSTAVISADILEYYFSVSDESTDGGAAGQE